MDYVYPAVKAEEPVYNAVDKDAIGTAIIDLIERGALNYKGFPDGARLPKIHVCSIICSILGCKPSDVKEVYEEIKAEKRALEAIHPCEFTTLTSFRTALEAVSHYITVETWIDKLKTQYGVGTWTAMQEWCAVNYNKEV